MRAKILDTKTGQKFEVNGPHSRAWAHESFSCDCNRHPGGQAHGNTCEGRLRFIVIAARFESLEDEDFTLAELNSGYDRSLLAKHGIV